MLSSPSVISILFLVQLTRFVVSIVYTSTSTNATLPAFSLIIGMHEMLNVIIISIISTTLFY